MDTLLPSETHGLLPLLSQVPKSFVTEKSNVKDCSISHKDAVATIITQKHNCK